MQHNLFRGVRGFFQFECNTRHKALRLPHNYIAFARLDLFSSQFTGDCNGTVTERYIFRSILLDRRVDGESPVIEVFLLGSNISFSPPLTFFEFVHFVDAWVLALLYPLPLRPFYTNYPCQL